MERLSNLSLQLKGSPSTSEGREWVIYEHISDVAVLSLNSPHNGNILTSAVVRQLNSALLRAEQSPEVRAIILMGAGPCFSQGGHISLITNLSISDMLFTRAYHEMLQVLPKIKKPVIAAIHGQATGLGFELALLCDLIVADSSAQLGISNIKAAFTGGAAAT